MVKQCEKFLVLLECGEWCVFSALLYLCLLFENYYFLMAFLPIYMSGKNFGFNFKT